MSRAPFRIDVTQLGARMHYAVPAGFAEAGELSAFFTDLWYPRLQALLPEALFRLDGFSRLKGRYHPAVPADKVRSCPLRGVRYAYDLQNAPSEEERFRHFVQMGRWFAGWVAQGMDDNSSAIYAYNSAALEIFTSGKAQNKLKVLEQTLVPRAEQRTLLAGEYRRHGLPWPEDCWNREYELRERREWEEADLIICGSDFVKQRLINQQVAEAKIAVVPYGTNAKAAANPGPAGEGDRFRLLFAGHGGIRKGVPYLIDALDRISSADIELTIAGDVSDLPETPERAGKHPVRYPGKIDRDRMQEMMRNADAFVFPSLCEGSATVIYEALQAGKPIICTPNSGSVITHNHDGLIVPAADAEQLAEAIGRLAGERSLQQRLSRNAVETAKNYSAASFVERLRTVIHRYAGC